MREISTSLQQWLAAGRATAIATVIKTWGSSPRPAGAKMAINDHGEFVGSVSGGCVETAVIEAAREVIQTGKPRLLQFGVSNEQAWEVGLSCGGKIEVFVTKEFCNHYLNQLERNEPFVVAAIVRGDEALLGRRLLLRQDGTVLGDIADEAIIAAVREQAQSLFSKASSTSLPVGECELFVESCFPPPKLIIIGAVHVAVPLVAMARALDFTIILIDPRGAFATAERFAHIDQLISKWPDEALVELGIDASTCIVILTHDPKIDDPAIKLALQHAPAFLGVLGSRRTHEKRLQRLRADGLSEEQLAQIHAPIGLDIGARSPAEIAVSILAEIVACRRK